MRTVTIHEAKTHLSRILREVEAGQEVLLARGKKPVARIVPYHESRRQFDSLPDLIVRMDDSFDDPLDDFAPYMVAEEPS